MRADEPPYGWNADHLKNYMESMFAERDTLHLERAAHLQSRIVAIADRAALALDAARDATRKSETATEKRFDAVNEFRAQLNDERASLMRQDVADRSFSANERRIKSLETFQSKLLGAFGLAVVLMPALTAIVVYLIAKSTAK